jgi:lipopolysaccharide export system permease protein
LIINRYLIREILKPMAGLCGVLVFIFVSYTVARYLTKAADGLIAPDLVLKLVMLRTIIGLEALLPIALYLSVVVGLGRMYTDQEMSALSATGFSEMQVAGAVLKLAFVVAIIVSILSLYGRPWAYDTGYRLEAAAESTFNLNELQPRQFYEGTLGGRTLHAERVNQRRGRLEYVFIKAEMDNRARVIVAEEAYQDGFNEDGVPILRFLRGYVYELHRGGGRDHVIKFGEMTLIVDGYEVAPLGFKRKAAPTLRLARSDNIKEIAELQWRLSTPIATLLLALLGIPISRTSPRQGKYGKMMKAVLIYIIYFNLSAMAKAWLEEGIVGPMPGIWWTNALLLILLVFMLLQPRWSFWLHQKLHSAGGRR